MRAVDKLMMSVVQSASLLGNVKANLATVETMCARASEQGADIVLFPETYLCGYSYRSLGPLVHACAEPLSGPMGRRLSSLARKHNVVISAGMFERDGDSYYNTQAVAFPDGRLERQRKGEASDLEVGLLATEAERRVFEWKGVRFGILVCADIDLIDFRSQFRQLDISLLLHPCAGRIEACGEDEHQKLQVDAMKGFLSAGKLANELDVTYATANPVGFSGEDYYPGNSWIIRPDGDGVRLPATAREEEMSEHVAVTWTHEPGLELATAADPQNAF